MLMIDLQSSAVPTRPRPRVVEQVGRRRAGALAAVGLAVVAAVVVVGVARFSGGDDSGAPVSSVPTTTLALATTTAPAATTAPAVSSSTSVRPPTSSIAYLNDRFGAVFGEKVAFRLYAFDATTLRGYVDTATGQLVDAAASIPGDHVFAGNETRLFILNSRTKTLSSVDRNLRETPTTIAGDVVWAFPSAAGRLWTVIDRADSNYVSHVLEFAVDGSKTAELTIQVPFAVRGSLNGAIVTSAAGKIFLHDPRSGRVTNYAVGELTAVNGSRIAWLGCDAAPSCHTYIGDATRPQLTTLPVSVAQPESSWVLSLSPNGDAAVVPPGPKPGYRLLNFATGLDMPLSTGDDELLWSPDGKWLFNTNSSPPQAIDVPGGRTVNLALTGPDRSPFRVVPL
jgi:hypothetical protein